MIEGRMRRKWRSETGHGNRYWRRHPCDKPLRNFPWLRQLVDFLKNGHTWRRHPAPFNKTRRGLQRRRERRWAAQQREIVT